MFTIWAKTYDEDNRITRNDVFRFSQEFDSRYLYAYMVIIANKFRIETPVVLSKHILHLETYNAVKFNASDFIDKTDFTRLTLELINE